MNTGSSEGRQRRRRVRLPGYFVDEDVGEDIADYLQASALQEMIMDGGVDSHNNSHSNLVRQSAITAKPESAELEPLYDYRELKTSEKPHSELPRQSKSDPCYFRIKEVDPVQECNGESASSKPSYTRYHSVGANEKSKSFDLNQMSSQGVKAWQHFRGIGSRDNNAQNAVIEEDTICDDGVSNFADNNVSIDQQHLHSPRHIVMDSDDIKGIIHLSSNAEESIGKLKESQLDYQIKSSPNTEGFTFGISEGGSSRVSSASSFAIGDSCLKMSTLHSNSHSSSLKREEYATDSLMAIHQDLYKLRIMDPDILQSQMSKLLKLQALTNKYNKFSRWRKEIAKPSPPLSQEIRSFSHNVSMYGSCSSLFSGFDHKLWKSIEAEARCQDRECQLCMKVRKSLSHLKDFNFNVKADSQEELVLMHMYEHSLRCDVERCIFYWCERLPKNVQTQGEMLSVIKLRVENNALDSFVDNPKQGRFIKLHPDIADLPRENFEWTAICRLTSSRKSVLALPMIHRTTENPEYWVLKKVGLIESDSDSSHSQTELVRRLQTVKDPGILQPLWAATYVDTFVVCCRFEAWVPLTSAVKVCPVNSLPLVVNLMLQLVDVTQHLHQKGILFLSWSGSNVAVDQTLTHIKLVDFTCSTLKQYADSDIADIRDNLPLHLHPPELLTCPPHLAEESDVWGLGCLLHEMVTGKYVWHQFQHDSLKQLKEKMLTCKSPIVPLAMKELSVIFKSCWEISGSDRASLSELKQLFFNI